MTTQNKVNSKPVEDLCSYCGKAVCPCYDESEPDTNVPQDSTTDPARWGGAND